MPRTKSSRSFNWSNVGTTSTSSEVENSILVGSSSSSATTFLLRDILLQSPNYLVFSKRAWRTSWETAPGYNQPSVTKHDGIRADKQADVYTDKGGHWLRGGRSLIFKQEKQKKNARKLQCTWLIEGLGGVSKQCVSYEAGLEIFT